MSSIPVGSGLSAQLVVADETTYGVAANLGSGDSFEFNSETLDLKKTPVVGTGLAAGKLHERTKRRVITRYDVTGDIAMDLPTRNLGFWLRYMMGSFGQALSTPTQIGTTGVYRQVHQPGTFFGKSFSAQKGVPATNATVLPHTVVGGKLTGWEIAVATGALATLTLHVDGRNMLSGAGNGDPLNTSIPALASFGTPTNGLGTSVFHFREATLYSGGVPIVGLPSPAAPSLSTSASGGTVLAGVYQVEVTYVNANGETLGSVASSITTTGSVSTLTIQSPIQTNPAATGWYAYVTQVNGSSFTRQQAPGSPTAIGTALTLTAPPTNTGLAPPSSDTATESGLVSLAGATPIGQVKDCTFGYAFSEDNQRIFIGGNGFKSEPIESGYRSITGSLTAEFDSAMALENAFLGDTTTSLELTFVGPSVSGGAGYLLDIIIPNIKLEGESPKVPGAQVITQQVNFTGYDDEATVPYQFTYQSEDTTF